MKPSDFEKKFEAGENITKMLDLTKAKRRGLEIRRVNVDFPEWMIESLDKEAQRLGITRQALLKVWVADKLEHQSR